MCVVYISACQYEGNSIMQNQYFLIHMYILFICKIKHLKTFLSEMLVFEIFDIEILFFLIEILERV
jgi:hypothetical protein